jgi:hypothetical protein
MESLDDAPFAHDLLTLGITLLEFLGSKWPVFMAAVLPLKDVV